MRYQYFFKNTSDIIIDNGLNRNQYYDFIDELSAINLAYNFEIYLGGDYLEYISTAKDSYTDIKFFLMAENVIDLRELAEFFRLFHGLAKKYGFIYDLMYFMDATENDLVMDPKNYLLLNKESARIIKFYYKRISLDTQTEIKDGIYEVIDDSDLYESTFYNQLVTNEIIKKIQKKSLFQKALKISQ